MASGYFQRLQEESRKFYQKLSRTQKWVLGSLIFFGLVALVLIGFWARQPQWSPLYADLSVKDAGQIVAYLKENDIPYKVQTIKDGSLIEVPSEKVHELRLQMAALDMPLEGGVMGFEIFDKDGNMSMTNRVFDVNYQRALAGELARTIMEIDAVEKARVHLAIPPKQIFTEMQEPPTASVTLKMAAMSNLSERQIKGISKLVAGSVSGLDQEHVTIADTSGNLLFDGEGNSGSEQLANLNRDQLQYQKSVENEIRHNVERILGRVVGAGRVNVQVRARLDFDQEESVSKSFQANDNNNNDDVRVLRSEKEISETGQGTEPVSGGVPGAESNLPGYREQTSSNNASYARKDTTRNYEVPEVETKRVKDPGQITRLTLSVAVDSQSPAINAPEGLDSNDPLVQNMRNLAVGAAGLDLQRGDTIAIYALPFEGGLNDQVPEQSEAKATWVLILLYSLAGLGLLLLLFLLWYFVRKRNRQAVEGENLDSSGFLPSEENFPSLESPEDPEFLEASSRRARAVNSLTEMAQDNPAQVARLLKVWMQES